MASDSWDELETWAAGQPASRRAITAPLPPAPAHASSTFSPALAGATEVVSLVRRLADGQSRDDLVEQLDLLRAHLRVEPIPVVVIGGAGQGKSSVVNALVGAEVCPVGPNGVTTAPLAITYHDDYRGEIVIDPGSTGQQGPTRRRIGFGDAASLGTNAMNPENRWALRLVELGVPSPTLARGLVLVDTPAIAEVWSLETARILRAVTGASCVILVTSAASELTAGELDLLRAAASLCHRLVVVVNGTNAFPQWRSIVERNQLLLEQRGVPAKVFGVAATPYWGDAGGVPPGPDPGMQTLAAHLEEAVVLDTEHQRISKALVEAFWAADRLRMRLYAERSLIGDGDGIDQAAGRLRQAAHDAQELCSPGAAWRIKLDEGLRDLQRDIDQDLDTEMRRLAADAEAQVAGIGTTASWDDVHLAVHHRLANAIVHVQRVRKLAIRGFCKRVADQFQLDWSKIVSTLDMASEAHALLNPRLDRPALNIARSFADLALPPRDASALGIPVVPDPSGDPHDPRSQAFAIYRTWLAVTEHFLRVDNDETLVRVANELETRCQHRGIELHRSIVEVFTTLNVLRHLDPEMVLQRHVALAEDLEKLQSLDFQLHHDDRQPKLGY